LNWPTLAIKLSGQLGLYTDNIIISYSLSPATVVPFFVTQRLAAMAQSHIQNVGNATWAALADLYIKGEKEKFNSRLIELTRLVSVMGLASGIAIIAYNQYFINLWVGSARFGGDGLTILAVCNSLLIGLISLWGWCFSGTGTQARLVVPTTLAASVNFLASIGCTHFFGITGPLMGTFISFITISIWKIPLLLQEVFGTSMKQLFWAVTKPLIFGIPYGVTVWWIAKLHTPWYWLGLAAEIGLSSLIYLVIAWFLVFNDSERTQWSQRLSKLLPSRPKF
jgi:O-antigen/teichoic acid export membrane protein